MTTLKTNVTALSLDELNPGTWSNSLADASDILTPMQEIEAEIDSARDTVTVNDADTTWGTLLEKLIANSGLTIDTVDTAGSLQLRINLDSKLLNLLPNLTSAGELLYTAIDSTGLTEGEYLTVGALNTISSAPDSGVVAPLDQVVTAGETLSERDLVYRDLSDGKYYKVDVDVVPIKLSDRIGFVVESGGISLDASGSVRFIGNISGFVGLTIGQPVYASNTAGLITQTISSVINGGSQVAIVYIGEAISATEIITNGVVRIQYFKRATLSNNATLTIEHHADTAGYLRHTKALLSGGVEQVLIVGQWTNGTPDVGVQYGDTPGNDKGLKTSFKNRSGGSIDISCIVEMEY